MSGGGKGWVWLGGCDLDAYLAHKALKLPLIEGTVVIVVDGVEDLPDMMPEDEFVVTHGLGLRRRRCRSGSIQDRVHALLEASFGEHALDSRRHDLAVTRILKVFPEQVIHEFIWKFEKDRAETVKRRDGEVGS